MSETTNKYNVNIFDGIEVKYIDSKNLEQKKFFDDLTSAKKFIENSLTNNIKILPITYFIYIMVGQHNSHIVKEPNKRFAEHSFSAEDFLFISPQWIENTRSTANKEIDNYMKEHFGASIS